MAASKKDVVVTPYVRGNPPSDPTDLPTFLTTELRRLELTLSQVTNLVPQVATAAPKSPLTTMIRYAKSPWNPLGTGDGWVKFDGTSWTALT